MVDIGNANDDLMINQNVLVETAPTAGAAAAVDEITTLTFCQFEQTRPEQRTDHGTSHVYNYGSPDVTFFFTASANSALLAYLNARFSANARNVPNSYPWSIQSTANDGTSSTRTFSGPLIHNQFAATPTDQTSPASVEARIRVMGAISIS